MKPLLRPARPDRGHVLAMVADLRADLDAVTVDEIDGEFYWRCCRMDLLEPIFAFHRDHGACPAKPSDTATSGNLVEFVKDSSRWAFQLLRMFDELRQTYPRSIFTRLWRGERVSLRMPDIIDTWEDDGTLYRILVYSGSWTGADVERAFREQLDNIAHWLLDRPLAQPGASLEKPPPQDPNAPYYWVFNGDDDPDVVRITTFLEFRIVREPRFLPEGTPVRTPHVELTVRTPLPVAGEVARQYDAVVRDVRKWHLLLPGGANWQEREVTLRTWGVGLLMGTGVGFDHAMRQVCEEMRTAEVSQTCFGGDRRRLVTRVPEAREYLFARDERPSALAKASAASGPLQGEPSTTDS